MTYLMLVITGTQEGLVSPRNWALQAWSQLGLPIPLWGRHLSLSVRLGTERRRLRNTLRSQSSCSAELGFKLRVPSLRLTVLSLYEKRIWDVASLQRFFLFLRSLTLWSQCPFKRVHGRSWGFPGGSVVKNLPANAGDAWDTDSTPGLGRSPGEGHGNPLQYSCLEIPRTGEPGGLQSMDLLKTGHDWATNTFTFQFNSNFNKREIIHPKQYQKSTIECDQRARILEPDCLILSTILILSANTTSQLWASHTFSLPHVLYLKNGNEVNELIHAKRLEQYLARVNCSAGAIDVG